MNPKATLLLIKGEIKTSEVISCTPSEDAQSWAVTFASGKTYTYKSSSIELLDSPEQPDPNLYQISRNGKRLFHITAIYIFRGKQESFWHLCFQDGSERDYRQSELTVATSCLDRQKPAGTDVFAYLRQIAEISDLKHEETGETLLTRRFETIGFVGEDVALAKYLDPVSLQKEETSLGTPDTRPFSPSGAITASMRRSETPWNIRSA